MSRPFFLSLLPTFVRLFGSLSVCSAVCPAVRLFGSLSNSLSIRHVCFSRPHVRSRPKPLLCCGKNLESESWSIVLSRNTETILKLNNWLKPSCWQVWCTITASLLHKFELSRIPKQICIFPSKFQCGTDKRSLNLFDLTSVEIRVTASFSKMSLVGTNQGFSVVLLRGEVSVPAWPTWWP